MAGRVFITRPIPEPGPGLLAEMASELAGCANTVLLPHLGNATVGTRAAMSRKAAENLIAALSGRRPADLVNPEAWREPVAEG